MKANLSDVAIVQILVWKIFFTKCEKPYSSHGHQTEHFSFSILSAFKFRSIQTIQSKAVNLNCIALQTWNVRLCNIRFLLYYYQKEFNLFYLLSRRSDDLLRKSGKRQHCSRLVKKYFFFGLCKFVLFIFIFLTVLTHHCIRLQQRQHLAKSVWTKS